MFMYRCWASLRTWQMLWVPLVTERGHSLFHFFQRKQTKLDVPGYVRHKATKVA